VWDFIEVTPFVTKPDFLFSSIPARDETHMKINRLLVSDLLYYLICIYVYYKTILNLLFSIYFYLFEFRKYRNQHFVQSMGEKYCS